MDEVVKKGGFCVYTDGSGFEGGVGAEAVAMRGGLEGEHRTRHLGDQSEHTVFESEVAGGILALDIIKTTPRLTDVDIFMDCQPAIIAISAPKPQPGQYLVSTFHDVLRRLLSARRSLKICLHWVPAHFGIAGNEAVDACAKEAALGASSPLSSRIRLFDKPLPLSKSAAIDAGARAFRERWLTEWSASPRFTRISLFDDARPSNPVSRM
jgi:ribonuclease HI